MGYLNIKSAVPMVVNVTEGLVSNMSNEKYQSSVCVCVCAFVRATPIEPSYISEGVLSLTACPIINPVSGLSKPQHKLRKTYIETVKAPQEPLRTWD